MSQETEILMHEYVYSLRNRPSRNSQLVKTSRSSILLDLLPKSLSRDVHKLDGLLQQIEKQLHFNLDEDGLKFQMEKPKFTLLMTVQMLHTIQKCSELFLKGQKDVGDAIEQQQSSAVQGLLQRSEKLVESLLPLLSVISNTMTKATDLVGESIDDMLASAIEDGCQIRKLNDNLIEVRATRAKALLAHSALVDKMIATGKEYAHAACEERRAWRLAMAAKTMRFATWVGTSICGGDFSWTDSDPAQCTAEEALLEKQRIMLKRFQIREEARAMLRTAMEKENILSVGLREIHTKERHVQQMEEMARLAKYVMVILMRLGSFWTQTKSELENILCDTKLLSQFFRRASQLPGSSSNDGVLNAADTDLIPPRKPGRALTRSVVQLFSRWVAIADVCTDVLQASQGSIDEALLYNSGFNESVKALVEVVETRMDEMRASHAISKA